MHSLHSIPKDVWIFLGIAAACLCGWKIFKLTFKSLGRIVLLAVALYLAWRWYHGIHS